MEQNERTAKLKSVAIYASIIIFPAILFSCILALVFVEGNSMAPNLASGSLLLCNRHAQISTGDVVVFNGPDGKILVKRVIGTAGDEVSVHNGICTVNGVVESSSYRNLSVGEGDDFDASVVPSGHIFVMGDNRGISLDSRDVSVGWVDLDDVICTMMVKLR